MSNMFDTKRYRINFRLSPLDDPEYRIYAWDELRRKAGNELYKLLEQSRNPAVVKIGELEVTPEYFRDQIYDKELRIEIEITPCEYQQVMLPSHVSLISQGYQKDKSLKTIMSQFLKKIFSK